MAIKKPRRNQNGSTPKKSPSPPQTPATIRFVRERRNAAPLTFISTSNPIYPGLLSSKISPFPCFFSVLRNTLKKRRREAKTCHLAQLTKTKRQAVGCDRSCRPAHLWPEAKTMPQEKQFQVER